MNVDYGRVLFLALIAMGCSDPEPRSPGSGGNGGTTGGTSGRSGSGGSVFTGGTGGLAGMGATAGSGGTGGTAGAAVECNDLVLEAPAWGASYTPDPAPEPMGGDIEDGTYYVTRGVFYEVASGPEVLLGRTQMEISGNTWQSIDGHPDDPSVPARTSTETATTAGTSITLTRTCPTDGTPDSAPYTATSDGIALFFRQGGMTAVTVLEKQ
jgi:hypothetical protein